VAGARGRALEERRRCSRMARAVAERRATATTRRVPPQRGQVRTSVWNVRRRSSAQGMGRRGWCGPTGSGATRQEGAWAGGAGAAGWGRRGDAPGRLGRRPGRGESAARRRRTPDGGRCPLPVRRPGKHAARRRASLLRREALGTRTPAMPRAHGSPPRPPPPARGGEPAPLPAPALQRRARCRGRRTQKRNERERRPCTRKTRSAAKPRFQRSCRRTTTALPKRRSPISCASCAIRGLASTSSTKALAAT
jgi:hypothetical protein